MGYIEHRETTLRHPEAENRSMALPEGVFCETCRIFPWCNKLSDVDEKNESCQWYPNRYQIK